MLKREFNPRDVQRMRNLITGNTLDNTQIQVGWEKGHEVHREGDIWEENGRKWTIKNGLKQTVRKYGKFKQIAILPLVCETCKNPMEPTDLNKKMYFIHKKCFDCVIKIETALKAEGKYEEYEKGMLDANRKDILTDLEQALLDWYNAGTTFVTENGEVEDWGNTGANKEIYEKIKDQIEKEKAK